MAVALILLILTTVVFGSLWGVSAKRLRELTIDWRWQQNRIKELTSAIDSEPKAVCLCSHGINYHRDGGGRCDQQTGWEEVWPFKAERPVKCRCKRYTGPEPLPSYYHPLELER